MFWSAGSVFASSAAMSRWVMADDVLVVDGGVAVPVWVIAGVTGNVGVIAVGVVVVVGVVCVGTVTAGGTITDVDGGVIVGIVVLTGIVDGGGLVSETVTAGNVGTPVPVSPPPRFVVVGVVVEVPSAKVAFGRPCSTTWNGSMTVTPGAPVCTPPYSPRPPVIGGGW